MNAQTLQEPQKSSSSAMQTLQRQQTQPGTPVPALSTSRVTSPSVADDLDALLSKTLAEVASLPVTGVMNAQTLQEPQKSSSSAMQTLQRQQTQPGTPVPALSTSRVTSPSVADDLNALLSETLAEIETVAAPTPLVTQPEKSSYDIQEDLVGLATLPIAPSIGINLSETDIISSSQDINNILNQINQFFKRLLSQEESLPFWLEKESKTSFFSTYCPFAASYFLKTHLDKATPLQPHLNKDLILDWQQNYARCVSLLKRNNLEAYNKTDFPFTGQYGIHILSLQMINQQPELLTHIADLLKNPELLQAAMENLNKPGAMPAEIMEKEFQEKFQQFLQAEMEGLNKPGAIPAEMAEMIEKEFQEQFQPLVTFFHNLDQQLQEHPKERDLIDAWLKSEASKPDYQSPFFITKRTLNTGIKDTLLARAPHIYHALKALFENCSKELVALGLQQYIEEGPSPTYLTQEKKYLISQKEMLERTLTNCLSFFKNLDAVFQTLLPTTPEDLGSTRQKIEDWYEKMMAKQEYGFPFFFARQMLDDLIFYEGILDQTSLNEMSVLYPRCRDRLIALGLEKYTNENPLEAFSNITPAAVRTPAAAPKKGMSDTQRFENEIKFFRLLIVQDDKTVDQWLKDNSPKFDYPLLWGKKRFSILSSYRDSVNIEIRRNWRTCCETCLEKINTAVLRHHLDIEQIPADASPELRVFLSL
jgi:hypothetical protein